jgi:hypothetical protein
MGLIWQKIWSDIWNNKSRTLQIVASGLPAQGATRVSVRESLAYQ